MSRTLEFNEVTYLFGLKGAYLAPLSILMSAIIGASVALWAVRSNRSIARLKNSMDFINSFNEANDIAKGVTEIVKLRKISEPDRKSMATPSGQCEATIHIRTVLNYYESMAICINHKIYDDEIIKETLFSTVVKIWKICKPFVDEQRSQRDTDTIYQELEGLVINWNASPLEKKELNK